MIFTLVKPKPLKEGSQMLILPILDKFDSPEKVVKNIIKVGKCVYTGSKWLFGPLFIPWPPGLTQKIIQKFKRHNWVTTRIKHFHTKFCDDKTDPAQLITRRVW